MSCCCTKTYNYCKQNVCGEIDFDVLAQISGTHTLKTEFLGKSITIEKDFIVEDNIVFPLDQLNENFEYTVELYDPEGAKIIIESEGVDYDCFKFRTMINETVNLVTESGS